MPLAVLLTAETLAFLESIGDMRYLGASKWSSNLSAVTISPCGGRIYFTSTVPTMSLPLRVQFVANPAYNAYPDEDTYSGLESDVLK